MIEHNVVQRVVVALPDGFYGLIDLLIDLGHDPYAVSISTLQKVADGLSACIPEQHKSWGWRYLRNVINGKLNPSKDLLKAIEITRKLLAGMSPEDAEAKTETVIVTGQVSPGCMILVDEKICAYPFCDKRFIGSSGQKYHSIECRKLNRKLRMLETKKATSA